MLRSSIKDIEGHVVILVSVATPSCPEPHNITTYFYADFDLYNHTKSLYFYKPQTLLLNPASFNNDQCHQCWPISTESEKYPCHLCPTGKSHTQQHCHQGKLEHTQGPTTHCFFSVIRHTTIASCTKHL